MYIRLAQNSEAKSISCSIRNKKIDYNTARHVYEDLRNKRLYVLIDNNEKIIASCALVEESNYNYTAIKRLAIFKKENYGKGIASQFIKFFINTVDSSLGCTPWIDNIAMKKLLEKFGFQLQYIFSENHCFYLKQFQ